jgi:hypothetical protein
MSYLSARQAGWKVGYVSKVMVEDTVQQGSKEFQSQISLLTISLRLVATSGELRLLYIRNETDSVTRFVPGD